jgi:hypothetical protein
MRLHVPADKYKLNGGTIIADLITDAARSSVSPGVVINNYGKGRAISFLYNLPKNIVPSGQLSVAGVEKDGIFGLRPWIVHRWMAFKIRLMSR